MKELEDEMKSIKYYPETLQAINQQFNVLSWKKLSQRGNFRAFRDNI